MIKDILSFAGNLERIHRESVKTEDAFVDLAARFADHPGTIALMSGGTLDSARYHLLAVDPWITVKSYGRRLIVEVEGHSLEGEGDPLNLIRQILEAFRLSDEASDKPVSAGLFGYIAYDIKDFIEVLPRTAVDDLGLPQVFLCAPSAIMIQDMNNSEIELTIPVRNKKSGHDWRKYRRSLLKRLSSPKKPETHFSVSPSGFSSLFTRNTYMSAVEKVKEYIASGHIYQVNLSQRFESGFTGNPFEMFKTLYSAAPAPFYAYVNAGDHQIVSTSPERFLMRRGNCVETRPIKGTRPRGKSREEDRQMAEELQNSRKDDAELSMIVDLMRNDLGRVCAGGTVKVTDHRRLEPYANVFHLVSVIKGRLVEGKDAVDIIRAAFPGGSITGCPRIRAMEIIDELEPRRRHIYTGSIGYIGFDDTMDLSIAIRTATIFENRIHFSVGGGIVYDSDPADEYEETLHKGRSIMGVFENRISDSVKQPQVWFDGLVVPESEARIPVSDKGFQYGYGIFETIRVESGVPLFLDEHMQRFSRSWKMLFNGPEPDLTWRTIIEQVIVENGLVEGLAAVKIMASAGENRPKLVVTARPYIHRLEQLRKPGVDLKTYPHSRQTPLADHKTMNYLYYLLAGTWAQNQGADEALIMNPDGSISETSTANILMIENNRVIRPASTHVLPGIMEKQVLSCLERKGYEIEERTVELRDLPSFDTVLITNSLIGAVPVEHIDNAILSPDASLCSCINRELFSV